MNKYLLSACGLALAVSATGAVAVPVIPGASGFGIETPAGRGGKVHRVTNLNASGAGSLKACVDATGPRVCVFEVAGTINLSSELTVRNPYLTIAGQTAPSPGITLRGAALKVENTHDVLVQHMRIRVGDGSTGPDPSNRDGLIITAPDGGTTKNIVIDHVSVSWGVDENIQVWFDGVSDVTFRNVITSEGLYNSIHPEGVHSMGMILGPGTSRVSVIGTLFAHNYGRNYLSQGEGGVYVNNVVYDRGSAAIVLAKGTSNSRYSFVGNHFVRGPDTLNNAEINVNTTTSGIQMYLADNIGEGQTSAPSDQWSLTNGGSGYRVNSSPLWPAGLVAKPSSRILDYVLDNAGARPADRDDVDARVVNDVRNGTGRIINSQSEVGGWPRLSVNSRPLQLPANPNADDDRDGYTNLEEWLHGYSAAVEGKKPVAPQPPTDLRVSVIGN